MDKLIPLEVSIRQDQMKKKQDQQRQQLNNRMTDRHFSGSSVSDAYRDDYISSAYHQVKTHSARMNEDLIHATSSTPYHRRKP